MKWIYILFRYMKWIYICMYMPWYIRFRYMYAHTVPTCKLTSQQHMCPNVYRTTRFNMLLFLTWHNMIPVVKNTQKISIFSYMYVYVLTTGAREILLSTIVIYLYIHNICIYIHVMYKNSHWQVLTSTWLCTYDWTLHFWFLHNSLWRL